MNKIDELKNELREIVQKAPDLPPEIKQHSVYVEKNGQKKYLNAYIPFIGEKYGQATKILFYCVAQSLGRTNTKCLEEYANDAGEAIDRLELREPGTLDIDIAPVNCGVLPAFAGLLLHAKDNLWKVNLADVLQYLSVTNFYKYSLWDSKKNDLNPDYLLEKKVSVTYINFIFDNFIKQEITILEPDCIFICGKGAGIRRHALIANWLTQQKLPVKLHLINDPASLLHGGKIMGAPLENEKVEELIEIYCGYIKGKSKAKDPHFYTQYGGRVNQIKNYLSFYYQIS